MKLLPASRWGRPRRAASLWAGGLVLAAGLAFAPAASALPKIVAVCASGCDFTSVNAAANDPGTNAGDAIDVFAGTYNEQVSVPKQLNIFGAPGGPRPIITSSANPAFTVAAGGSGTTLTHLAIHGTGTDGSTSALVAAGAVDASDLDLSATRFCANLFAGTPSQLGPNVTATTTFTGGDCIITQGSAADSLTSLTVTAPLFGVDLSAGTLTDSRVNADRPLVMQNSGITVRRATLDGGTFGVQAKGSGLITDSVVTSSASGGPAVVAPGSTSDTLRLRNVTAYASGAGSVGLATGSTVIDAYDVIARGAGADVEDAAPGTLTMGYSNFVTTSGPVDTTTVGHNQSPNPLLVNPVVGPGGDFHISCAGSPVIGAGFAVSGSGSTDRDGVPHPNPPSIGAYEPVGPPPCAGPATGPATGAATPTGQRSAALKKCKKKAKKKGWTKKKLKKCKKKAKKLPA